MSTYQGSALVTKYAAYLIYKGTATAQELNLISPKIGYVYDITEGGELSNGNIHVSEGDAVCFMARGWTFLSNGNADTVVRELQTQFAELKEKIGNTDLTIYALKSDIPTIPENVSAFNNDVGYLTEHQSLEDYAKKSDIPDVSNFATFDNIPKNVSELKNDSGYLTEHQDLTEYLKRNEIPELSNFATFNDIPTNISQLNNDIGYLTQHQDLTEYAKKSDIPIVETVSNTLRKVENFSEIQPFDGDIVLYSGETTEDFKNGFFYKYFADTENEQQGEWRQINVQPENEEFSNFIAKLGNANGIAELDETGKVPSAQLPSYVDDVLEFDTLSDFPAEGESGKIYIAIDTNITYRWSGSTYVAIGSDLALGETSATAYRGDRGKVAYDHSQTTGNPHNTKISDISGLQAAIDNAAASSGSFESFAEQICENKGANYVILSGGGLRSNDSTGTTMYYRASGKVYISGVGFVDVDGENANPQLPVDLYRYEYKGKIKYYWLCEGRLLNITKICSYSEMVQLSEIVGGGNSVVALTQSAYNALSTKDSNTLYLIQE